MSGGPGDARRMFVDLVFEGGGVKGIGLVGAVSVLEERGYQPQCVAGSSAGAMVATLLVSGYTAAELKAIMLDLDFNRFKDPTWQSRIPLVGGLISVLMTEGLYKGDYLHELMRQYLTARGVHSFKDLRGDDPSGDPRYRYRAQVIASDISGRRLLVLPKDAGTLGIDPDDLDVAQAVRMSMSIPLVFTPVRIPNHQQGEEHVIVDGGMLSNFPVWLFDSAGEPPWPTFGLKLVEPDPRTSIADRLPPPPHRTGTMHNVIDYARSLIGTMTEFHDRLYLEQDSFVRTIMIPTLGIRTTDFDLSRERKLGLYDAGRRAAETFLERWDFNRYVAGFRSGTSRSRRLRSAGAINQATGERPVRTGVSRWNVPDGQRPLTPSHR